MNTTTKKQIAQAVQNYIDKYNLSQADVANKAQVRKEYLSNILQNKFQYDAGSKKGDIPVKYFKQLAQLIDFTTQKQYWSNQATPQFVTTLATLQDAKEQGYTRLVIGDTGLGKSHTIKLFARKNPQDVYVKTVAKRIKKVSSFFWVNFFD